MELFHDVFNAEIIIYVNKGQFIEDYCVEVIDLGYLQHIFCGKSERFHIDRLMLMTVISF